MRVAGKLSAWGNKKVFLVETQFRKWCVRGCGRSKMDAHACVVDLNDVKMVLMTLVKMFCRQAA